MIGGNVTVRIQVLSQFWKHIGHIGDIGHIGCDTLRLEIYRDTFFVKNG
jgi:hypothetical protein